MSRLYNIINALVPCADKGSETLTNTSGMSGTWTVTKRGKIAWLNPVDLKNLSASAWTSLGTILPDGYRPGGTYYYRGYLDGRTLQYELNANGTVRVYNYGSAVGGTAINGRMLIVYPLP